MEVSIVLFDGVCNLCNKSVQFVIERDKQYLYKFAALQSEIGRQLLIKHGLPTKGYNSFVLIKNGTAYTKSTAAIKVMSSFNGLWKISIVLLIIPKFLRDTIYNYIAKNRYKWFGQQESCWLPSPELKTRFL